jgi:hypothetical protein
VPVATLLYAWQYYDLVITAANPKGKRTGLWFRAAGVTMASLGTVIATGFMDVYFTLWVWYIRPLYGHFNPKLAAHNHDNFQYASYIVFGFVSLCCIWSALLLGGTIYWVR